MLTRESTILACGVVIAALAASQGFAATRHVDPNDPSMFSSIQDAINVSRNLDIVIVHPGVYQETIDFIAKAITVQSTDPNDPDIVARTIIDGGGKTVVAFQSGEKEHAILSGFTIRKGHYGVLCAQDYTRPQIRQCVITSNTFYGIKGGTPTVTGCVVAQNGDHGIYANGGEIRDCVAIDNAGAGVCLSSSTAAGNARMVNCTVSGNKIDGVYCGGSLSLDMVSCVVSGNKAYGINSYYASGHVAVMNCTVVRNSKSGIYGPYSRSLAVSNSIVAYNLDRGLYYATSRYNNIYGNAGGDYYNVGTPQHDVQEEPMFADIGYWDKAGTWHDGDYHLMSTLGRWDPMVGEWVLDPFDSPCLDGGDPNTPIGSEPNPNGGIINLGAYGGTAEAGKSPGISPICTEYPEMDFNHDCKVDQADLDLFMEHWLECGLDNPNACWPQGPPAEPQVKL